MTLLQGKRRTGAPGLVLVRVLALLAGACAGLASAPVAANDRQPPPSCPPPVLATAPLPPAQDRGLLWRLEREGRTSWLYATVHAGRPHWARPGPLLAQALDAADVLALEVDPADPALLEAMVRQPPAPTLPVALQQRLQKAGARACFPATALAPLHPVLQLATLTLVEGRWLGLDAAFGVETLLAAQARQRGLPVAALESAATQMAALMPPPATRAADLAPQIERGLDVLESGRAREQLARLVQAWERGDLATLEAYPDWCDCVHTDDDRAALQRLNDDRNGPLADAISARHAAGQRVLAAVGALHMTGAQALPQLLAARGFRVQPVWPGARTIETPSAQDTPQEPR
jgi:uncharacterized protein YbaP (TraB family)